MHIDVYKVDIDDINIAKLYLVLRNSMWIGFAMLKMLHLLVGCRVLPPLLTILQNE